MPDIHIKAMHKPRIIMGKKLQQYKNNLNNLQIANGMNAASENALRLIEDANILFDQQRYPSALSLSILSIEESGKVSILREMAIARNGKELKTAWQAYRSHTKKNVAWIFLDLIKNGANKLEDFRDMFKPNSEHPYVLDNLKQIGFYTDCLGQSNWSIPTNIIDRDITRSILNVAECLTTETNHTEREVELWASYLGPVKYESLQHQKAALHDWFIAMKKEGLIKEEKVSFDDFLK
tara:strand:- start:192 stop:902 length:711 start_codon:yes stop_codon:yes gene_type:complete